MTLAPTLEDRQAFYDRLARHDWWYSYSDNHGVYMRGANEETALHILAREVPDFAELMVEFGGFAHAGKPKPARPK